MTHFHPPPSHTSASASAQRRRAWWPSVALAGLLVSSAPAWADDDCEVPAAQWQPRTAVQSMATQRGWQVERIGIDDGCYEVRGTDAQGQRFKAKLDPQTLDMVKFKTKKRRKDSDAQDGPNQAQGQGMSTDLPLANPASSAPTAPGTPGTSGMPQRPAIRSSATVE
ncbi:MAG: PepSY domain-containing protein [Comamonas sp.]|nr:PepSY domain-containing protein [Comamonas sp.]